jgi:hypothetical protein
VVLPGAVLAQFNSIFKFTEDAADLTPDDLTDDVYAVWTIDNFVAAGFTNASGQNYSVLDLSVFTDIKRMSDLNFDDSTEDLVITDQTGNYNFEIVLTGVDSATFLTNENFLFV